MKYTNEAGTIICNFPIKLSRYALDVYRDLNPETFSPVKTVGWFSGVLDQISYIHKQKIIYETTPYILPTIQYNNKVLLAFSGGLDSVYQAIDLKEKCYDITLFHVKNMNFYSNGKEFQVVDKLAKLLDLPIVYVEFKQTKNGPYKKYWKENSFKNTLLYSLMVDYCLDNNIYNISSGDDLRLDINDTVVGTNVADAHQITEAFFLSLPIRFIPVNCVTHKGLRLKKLQEYDLLNEFYSCVNPGRFNQSNHKRIEKKYNVEIEQWNCGVCRKCAFHSLLRYYFLHETYPPEFIEFCWKKICVGADYEFFKPQLPMETRINNLYDY